MAQGTTATEVKDRFDRSAEAKFDVRRGQLADAALATLGDLGYARTSLREISQKTNFSHGVLHYYFRDKTELISFCVRRYKEHCVTRYDEIIAEAADADALAAGFAEALVITLTEDTAMHRLWYDLRCQAMFEQELQLTIRELDGQLERMIMRVVARYCELSSTSILLSEAGTYAAFDGVFENALHRYVTGGDETLQRLQSEVPLMLKALTTGE